ncbi:hypothetical protein, partial [Klebsiella pneumoniae]
FPEWVERFASVLQVQPKGDK